MVQFIHRPGPGYTAPAWPSGTGAPAAASPPWATPQPSLAVGVWSNQLATVSQSSAPVIATVTTADGTVVKTMTRRPNRLADLGLPTGTYRVCVSQPATGAWNAAGGCATASWRAAVTATASRSGGHTAPDAGSRFP